MLTEQQEGGFRRARAGPVVVMKSLGVGGGVLGKALLHSDPVATSDQWGIRADGPQECFESFSVFSEDSRDRRGARSLNLGTQGVTL